MYQNCVVLALSTNHLNTRHHSAVSAAKPSTHQLQNPAHTNNCPVGVATQKEKLRARVRGEPEDVTRYFESVAEETALALAQATPAAARSNGRDATARLAQRPALYLAAKEVFHRHSNLSPTGTNAMPNPHKEPPFVPRGRKWLGEDKGWSEPL